MFQSWRLKLREAEESLRAGRLEDARRILADGELRQYLPGQRLTEKLIQGFIERSLRAAETGDALAGWSELESVRPLAGDGDAYLAAREQLLAHLASEVEARLVADDSAGALSLLDKIERRQIAAKSLKLLRDIAKRLDSARHLARRGKFAEADEQLQSATAISKDVVRSDLAFIETRRAALREKLETCRSRIEEMHRALAKPDWSRAATLADEVLEIAPEHALAQEAKKRAWAEVRTRCEASPISLTAYNRDADPSQHRLSPIGFPKERVAKDDHPAKAQRANFLGPRLFEPEPPILRPLQKGDGHFADMQLGELQLGAIAHGERLNGAAKKHREPEDSDRLANGSTAAGDREATERESVSPASPQAIAPRMLMWVDGVGGYLVCLASDVLIGQAVPATPVEIPILGDLSRRHAWIRRQGERYLIEPCRVAGDAKLAGETSAREAYAAVRINQQLIAKPTLLYDGDEIEMGAGVKLRFVQPHALSATARLDFLSRHRPQLRVDGVLLMAESCVLGPNFRNHVVCRDWKDDVVLYRHSDRLYCRAMDEIEIDGRLCEGRGELTVQSVVKGDDFSLALEAVRML